MSQDQKTKECETCGDINNPLCEDPGHCEHCFVIKLNTSRRERTCGHEKCLRAIYSENNSGQYDG